MKMGYRWLIAVMIFSSNCVNYMMRVNLSVNLVAMVPVGNNTLSASQVVLDWTPYQRGYILSGYFWGYLAGNLFGGPLATSLWGPRRLVFCTTFMSAILTLLSPAAAKHSFALMLTLRILLGFFGGFLFPATYGLIAKWAVPNERGKFVGAVISGSISTFITWTLCGLLIEAYGWEWGLYAFGIFSLLWTYVWWLLVYDSPEEHPRISEAEKTYIRNGIQQSTKQKISLPISQILTSIPIMSLCILNFGTGWAIYFIITAAPNYIANVLGFSISSTGVLSAMIYLMRSTASFIFAYLGDVLLKKELVSLRVLRKRGCFMSHVMPGILILGLSIPGAPTKYYLAMVFFSMMINGLVTISSAANGYDLTVNFIVQVSGLTTAFVTIAGIISPIITAHFTKNDETNIETWQSVFYLASTVLVVAGVQFILFGSTKTQPWNEIESQEETHNAVGVK